MELSSLVFSATTTELERASTVIASLVQDMSRVSAASANMARIQAQTEAILARAATESAKARKENARAADIEIKTIIAADKADAARAESIRKAAEAERRRTEATEESTRAGQRNVSILQRQSDILEFQAQGWSKGQSSILATAKAANIAADEMEKLQKVLETQRKLMGSDPFDKSMSGLTSLKNQYGELRESIRQYNTDSDLTSKQTKELARDKERLIEKMKTESASFSEIRTAVRAHNDEYVKLAGQYNNLAQAEANVIKNRKSVASATDYLTSADQKLSAALNTSNAAIDRSGTDLLVKYESALRKSGVAQDVATQKLAAYKAQLVQVQGQEEQRRAQHLTRSLSPQISDVVVSLWSGQSPFTVLLQQGMQVNDLFQLSGVKAEDFAQTVRTAFSSMVPAIKTVVSGVYDTIVGMFRDAGTAVTDYIGAVTGITDAYERMREAASEQGTLLNKFVTLLGSVGTIAASVAAVGIFLVVASLVGLAIGLKQVIEEEDKLALSLASSGGSLNLSHGAAIEYAKSMKGVGVTTGEAIEVITAMAAAGNFLAKEIKMVVVSATEMEKYAGVAVEDTVKQFSKLKEKPVEAILELAKTTGMIAPEVVKAVIELERQGKTADAVALAMTTLSSVNTEKVKRMKEDFSGLSLALIALKDAFSSFFAGVFKSLFYKENPVTKLTEDALQMHQSILAIESVNPNDRRLEGRKKLLETMKAELSTALQSAAAESNRTTANIAGAKAEAETEAMRAKFQGVVAKSKGEIVKLEAQRAKWEKDGLLTDERRLLIAQGIKDENKKIADELKKDAPKGDKKLDSFYDDAMKKFRDATIEANDATNELTKSQETLMEKIADPKFAKLSEQKKLDILQSGAAAIAIEKQKEAVIDLQKAEEFRDKILGKSEGLGKDYYAQMEALPKHAASLKLTTEQTDELIRKIYQGTPVWQKYNKSLEQADESLRKFTESSIAYQASTNAENQELDHRISLLGKTAEEQRKLQIEYQREMKINTARVELEKKLRDIAKEKAKAEKDGIVDTKKLQEFADAEVQARQDAAERIKVINKGVAVEYASDLDKEIAAIRGGISDSIVTALFEGGKEGSKKLRSVLEDALRKKVTIVVDAVVNTLIGSVVGSIAGAQGAGGASALGTAGNVVSLFGAGGMGGSLMAGAGWLTGATTLGGSLGAATSLMGTGTLAGITSGMGMVAGALGPIALGIGAIATLAEGFTSRGANHGGGIYSSLGQTNQEAASQLTGKLGWKDPEEDFTKRGNTELNKQVETTVKGLLELYNGLGKLASGTVKELEVVAGFATNSKYDDEESYGYFQIMEKATGKLLKEYTNRDMEKDGGKAWEQYVADLGTAMVTELRSSDIPSWMDGILKELGDAPTLESFQKAVVEIHKIDQAFSMFSKNIDGFTGMTDKSFEALMKASGGIDTLSGSLNSYYENFYTEEERMASATASLTEELAKSGVTMPATRDAYREMVTAALNAGEGGAELAAKLIQLSPAFAGITPAATSASKQLATLNKIISNVGLNANIKDVNFTDATKTLFESFGVAVEDYSNSIAGVIQGVITGKIKAEDAGKELADAAVGGITNAIAQGASQAIAAQFVSSIISPVIANIMAGKAALDGVDMQAGLDNLKNSTDALKTILNTIGPELADAFSGLGGIISSAANGATAGAGTNQYGGVGDSHFAIGGSANSGGFRSPELAAFGSLATETMESNKKVSELLQKLLKPEKNYASRYQELDARLAGKRDERVAVDYGWGNSTGQIAVTLNSLPDDIRNIMDKVKEFERAYADSIANEDPDEITSNIQKALFNFQQQLKIRQQQQTELEGALHEWYLSQTRLIAVDDLASLTEETNAATAKTQELMRTGGLEDPITKLKESFASKLKNINEGINKALTDEVLLQKNKLGKSDELLKGISPGGLSFDKLKEIADFLGVNTNQLTVGGIAHYGLISEQIKKKQEEISATIGGLEDEQKLYLDGLDEWYKAQADLLSTEMLVDINNQIRELESSEKGPLTTIKDAIQKYIDDFKALGTLTDDIQTQIDKLSGLQLTKARKSLYDQLLSPEELKTRDTLALTSEFSKLGKVIPDSTSSLRAMIDAANAAGNITLADNLLELVPAFLALQDAADGANGALSKAKTATDEAYAALERAVEAQRTILTESINKLKAVFDAAKNAAKTLYSEVDSVRKQSAEAGNAFIDQALQDLKNSGVIPDGVKLQDAIDSSMKGLSSEVYDSAFEEQRGRLILAGKLTTIADLTEPQLTLAQKQLKDLDAILETARAQIDELRGINTSVLSVATAVSNLAAAIAAEKATVVQPVVHPDGGVNPLPWQPTSTVRITGGDGAIPWQPTSTPIAGGVSPKPWEGVPGFDVGINNIPYDMPAYLHAGESVIPSEFNPFNPNAVSPLSLVPASSNTPVQQDNSEIIEENRLLRQELQAQNGAMVRLLSKVARVVERWDGDGLPEPRTETA